MASGFWVMKKVLALALAALLVAAPALAPVTAKAQRISFFFPFPGPGTSGSGAAPNSAQILTGNTGGTNTANNAERSYPFGTTAAATAAVLADSGVVSAAGTISKFRCWVGTAVSSTQTWTCKL